MSNFKKLSAYADVPCEWVGVTSSREEKLDQLSAENAKLRELVRDMFGGYKGAVKMLPSSYSKNVAERAVMDISDRMRELGVEVE